MLRGCLVFVICNSNSIHYFIFKLCLMVVHTLKMCTFYFVQISFFFFTFLTDVELRHFQAVFIPLYSNFVLWLFTQWTCTTYINAHLILYFWVFNLEIIKSPTVDFIVKFGCNLISFLYIWTLHIDCSHTDMHRWRRSRAEFGLVYCCSGCLSRFCVWSLFCYAVLYVLIVLQSSPLGRESCLLYFVCLPHGAVGWSAVCYCGISWSYSHAFLIICIDLWGYRIIFLPCNEELSCICHLL